MNINEFLKSRLLSTAMEPPFANSWIRHCFVFLSFYVPQYAMLVRRTSVVLLNLVMYTTMQFHVAQYRQASIKSGDLAPNCMGVQKYWRNLNFAVGRT